VRERFLARDITENVRLPRTRKASAAMSIPTAEEVGALVHTSEGWFTAYLAVCFFGGLRRGEASVLQVGDWDFLRKELHVQRQVKFTDDGRTEIRGPKYGSDRTVFVPERLVTIVSEHIRLHVHDRGEDQDSTSTWLFPSSIPPDTPVHAATVGRAWRALRGKVGIDHRLHDARHIFAPGLIAAGCDVVTVQRGLGHSSAAQTLTTYSHLWPDASDRIRKAAGDLLDVALGSTAGGRRKNSI
jgi:integrase